MTIDLEKLIAFADGELPPDEHAEVAKAVAEDATLQARLEQHQELRRRLSAAFDPTLEEAAPERLLAAARDTAPGNVIALAERRSARWSTREWGAMAASLAGGLIIGLGVMNAQTATIAATQDGLVARGQLARALDTQLAADTPGLARIGISFRDRDGAYCRTFAVERERTAGLACKRNGDWRLAMTASMQRAQGELRPASSDTPGAILTAVERTIAGEPLDAPAERRARDAGWRAPERPASD